MTRSQFLQHFLPLALYVVYAWLKLGSIHCVLNQVPYKCKRNTFRQTIFFPLCISIMFLRKYRKKNEKGLCNKVEN